MAKKSDKKLEINSTPTQVTLLTAIRDYEPVSRTRLADITGIQHAAISRAVALLLADGLVIEKSMADNIGPRRKRGLCLNPQHGYVIGMEYSPENMEAIAVNFGYQPARCASKNVALEKMSRKQKLDEIVKFLNEYRKECSSLPGKCLGVSLLDPGMVDTATGTAVFSSVMDDWKDVPVAEFVGRELGLPVMLPQSQASKMRAVDRFELKGNRQNLLYVEYGDGIGCGMKLSGKYLTGSSNFAGEMGHIHATDKDILCRCGAVGCLEAVSALPALVREVNTAIQKKCETSLAALPEMTGIDVLVAASQGDRLACRIVGCAFEYLAQAVSGLVNILDPEMVIFDNRMKLAGDAILSDFTRSMMKRFAVLYKEKIEVRFSEIKTHLGALGAAFSLMDGYIDSSAVT